MKRLLAIGSAGIGLIVLMSLIRFPVDEGQRELSERALDLGRRWKITYTIAKRQHERDSLRLVRLAIVRDSLKAVADNLRDLRVALLAARPRTQAESLEVCLRVNRECTLETISLREALGTAESELLIAREDLNRGWGVATAANPAIDTAAVAIVAGRCRILWFNCPTRTQSAVGGGLVGGAIVLLLRGLR